MYSKKIITSFVVLALGLSVFVFSGCADNIYERIEGIFYVYQEFGLVFDSETRNLCYNDEQVAFLKIEGVLLIE